MEKDKIEEDINKLKNLIYDKLLTLQNYDIIYEFIEKNSIPKTINQNGTFINLSLLSDNIILELYKIINSMDNSNTSQNLNLNFVNEIEKYKKNLKQTFDKQEIIIQYKKCKLTNLQKEILSFSFQ